MEALIIAALFVLGFVLLFKYVIKPIHDKGQNFAVDNGKSFGPWGALAGETAKLTGYKGSSGNSKVDGQSITSSLTSLFSKKTA